MEKETTATTKEYKGDYGFSLAKERDTYTTNFSNPVFALFYNDGNFVIQIPDTLELKLYPALIEKLEESIVALKKESKTT